MTANVWHKQRCSILACVSCRRSRFKFDYKTFGRLPNVTPSLEKEKHLQTTNFWGFMLVFGGVYICYIPVTLKPLTLPPSHRLSCSMNAGKLLGEKRSWSHATWMDVDYNKLWHSENPHHETSKCLSKSLNKNTKIIAFVGFLDPCDSNATPPSCKMWVASSPRRVVSSYASLVSQCFHI